MNNGIDILESIPTKIRYKNIIWIPENERKKESNSLSSEKIRCWIRFKNITEFNMADLKEAFPKWSHYAKSQIIYKINPLIKKNFVQQLNDGEFKVIKH